MQTVNKRGIRACDSPNPPLSLLRLDSGLHRGDPFDIGDKKCAITATLTAPSQTIPPSVGTNAIAALEIWSGITTMRPFAGVVITA